MGHLRCRRRLNNNYILLTRLLRTCFYVSGGLGRGSGEGCPPATKSRVH